jgi:ATP-dependent Lhr-like helicase
MRPGAVVAPQAANLADTGGRVRSEESKAATTTQPAANADIELDYVGSLANAAKVIAALYRGQKRLVFCDSKQLVEELGAQLRELGVTTYLIHASLSLDERHRAERAFAEGRDCVIVSTSALELGLDVGDPPPYDRQLSAWRSSQCPRHTWAFLDSCHPAVGEAAGPGGAPAAKR